MTTHPHEHRRFLLEDEAVAPALRKLALPSVVGMLVMALYTLIDGYFIGMLGDVHALAGVTVAFPIFTILMAVGQMIGIGGASFISRQLGARHHHRAEAAMSSVMLTVLLTSSLLTAALLFWLDPVLAAFGATEAALPQARAFAWPMALGSGFVVFNMAANPLIRAEGNTQTSMQGMAIGGLLNCLLGPLFMFAPIPVFASLGWHHSVRGAAWATFISQAACSAYLIRYLFSDRTLLRLRWRREARGTVQAGPPASLWDPEMLRDIGGVGLSTFARQALMAAAMLCLNNAAKRHANAPEAMLAAVGVAGRLSSLPFYAVIGYLQAYQPFAGYNYGAKKLSRLNEATRISVRFTSLLMLSTTLVTIIAAPWIARVFMPGDDRASLQGLVYATAMMRLSSLTLPLLAYHQVITSLYQSLGKIHESMVLASARNGFFFIPLAWLLPPVASWLFHLAGTSLWGFSGAELGVMLTAPVADLLTMALTLVLAAKIGRELRPKDL